MPEIPLRLPIVGEENLSPSARVFFDDVFSLLEQSPTAAAVAKKAKSHGVRLAYDPQYCQMAGCEAAYDRERQLVVFGGINQDPFAFAMVLCHELRHYVYGHERKDVQVDSDWSPMSMLKLTLAAEADTHAHELQMAFELAARKAPTGDSVHPRALDVAAERLRHVPDVAAIIDDGKNHPEKVADGRLMADFFRAFYGSASLRYAYEDHLINTMRAFPNALFSPRQYQGTLTSPQILEALENDEKPYVRRHLADLDLDGPFCASVYGRTAGELGRFKAIRDSRLGPRDEPGWRPDYIYGVERGNPRIIPPSPPGQGS